MGALCLSHKVSEAKQMIFNGDGKVVLALSKNLKLDIIKDGKTSKFELPDVSQATVTGTKVGTEFSLDISYDQEIASDGDAKLTKAHLKFDISHRVLGFEGSIYNLQIKRCNN